ncbi:MAG: EF2563 family selenium-dependent molybdenum hydroxylase system protein [Anaerolineaceae bacterium]|nr:EF2563 family selenium-dependent molybdenum hydroxylase system protein [Anaerolineaceae bacterium]
MKKQIKREQLVAIKGAGDLASGIALRLWRCGYRVILSELPVPLCIRRTIAFSSAVFDGSAKVEDAEGVLIRDISEAQTVWEEGKLPVIIDEDASRMLSLKPDVLIDARIIKTWREDTRITDAPLVIGLGPGFTAGGNVHCVIETNRGHNLGRVFWNGSAEPNTGVPGTIKGEGIKRVVKAPCSGVFHPLVEIGDGVEAGDPIARIGETEIRAQLTGIVRGIIYPGISVWETLKIMDIDPRGNREHCFTVSDKATALGGGVLEAILSVF